MFTNLHKHIELIESNKDTILTTWMEYEVVKKKLSLNTIEIDFFQEKFAAKVFDFSISIVKKENELGNYPVIGVMLMLFKKKNIPLSDIYMICVHFENSLLHFAYKNSILNNKVIKAITNLTDYNLEGVIKEYVAIYYKDIREEPVSKPKASKKKISTPATKSLKQTTSSHTSAIEYFKDVVIERDIVDELDELENDTINAIDSQLELDQNSLYESANLFEQYAKVLNMMYEFDELAYTLTLLKELLNNVDLNNLSNDTKHMVNIYLKAIINDLHAWRMSIFIHQDAQDIHYLDKTLLSSIAQIRITLSPSETTDDDEVEFF